MCEGDARENIEIYLRVVRDYYIWKRPWNLTLANKHAYKREKYFIFFYSKKFTE